MRPRHTHLICAYTGRETVRDSQRQLLVVVGDPIESGDTAPGQRPAVMSEPLIVEVLDHRELDGRLVIDAGPLAPSPHERCSHASSGTWVKRWSMRPKRGTGWDFGTAGT